MTRPNKNPTLAECTASRSLFFGHGCTEPENTGDIGRPYRKSLLCVHSDGSVEAHKNPAWKFFDEPGDGAKDHGRCNQHTPSREREPRGVDRCFLPASCARPATGIHPNTAVDHGNTHTTNNTATTKKRNRKSLLIAFDLVDGLPAIDCLISI